MAIHPAFVAVGPVAFTIAILSTIYGGVLCAFFLLQRLARGTSTPSTPNGSASARLPQPSGDGAAPASTPLVLHFDVNKTVLISDRAGGVGTHAMLNALLAETMWGVHEPGRKLAPMPGDGASLADLTAWALTGWRLCSEVLSNEPPADVALEPGQALIAYAEYVATLPRPWNWQLKQECTERGGAGEQFRPDYERLLAALTLPARQLERVPPELVDLFAGSRYHLLPSLFFTVNRLAAQAVASGRRFAVVFRTFGDDLAEVASEWNLFCAGAHPLHRATHRLDGSEYADLDLCIRLPEDTLRIVRTGDGLRGIDAALVSRAGLVTVTTGGAAVFREISERTGDGCRALAVQDDYEFWAGMDEASSAGKVLLVDRTPTAAAHHIFFDDNIELDHAHIVDARDQHSGETIPFDEAIGVYLVRCEPRRAITEEGYFIECIEACEKRRRQSQRPTNTSTLL